MDAPPASRYELGRLILDYIRTFMWPLVVLAVVVVGWADITEILRTREVNAFGLQVGQRVEQVEAETNQELADLQALVAELQAAYEDGEPAGDAGAAPESTSEPAAIATEIDTKIATLRSNLSREVEQIQRTLPAQQAAPPEASASATPSVSDQRRAAVAERSGFEALVARDLPAARRHFEAAAQAWPDYHNVAEISRLLAEVGERGARLGEADWLRLYRTILTRYSWGMPERARVEMRAAISRAG